MEALLVALSVADQPIADQVKAMQAEKEALESKLLRYRQSGELEPVERCDHALKRVLPQRAYPQ